jgi:hypothetical protein
LANKLLDLIKADPNPSLTVYLDIKKQEAKAADLRKQIEDERGKLQSERPGLEEFDEFCERFGGKLNEHPTSRESMKALIRSFVLRVDVNIVERRYWVSLKGARQSIQVDLCSGGWTLSPAPGWVLQSAME